MSTKKNSFISGGKSFAQKECGLNKSDATNAANGLRDKNKMARVIKVGTKYCVYEGPVSMNLKKRNAAAKKKRA